MGYNKRLEEIRFFLLKRKFYLGLFTLLPAFFLLFAIGGFLLALSELKPLLEMETVGAERLVSVYRSIETWAYILGAAALLSGMVVAYSLIRPAKSLLRAGQGDIEAFGSLSPEFKDMAVSFRRHIAELKDAAKMKEMLIELGKAERLASIGSLAMAVAHEVRNPLAAIKGLVQLLAEEGGWEPPRQARPLADSQRRLYLDTILKEVERLNRVVDGLYEMREGARPPALSGARPDGGERLVELLRRVRLLCGHAVKDKTVNVLEDYDEDAASYMVKDEKVFQALYNIALNAYEAVRPGGTINLGAGSRDGRMTVEVTSESEIEEGLKEKLFREGASTKGTGRGQGLKIAQALIRQAGGDITVASAGGKTAFTVRLP